MNPGNCLFNDSDKLDIRRDQPHRWIEMKVCVVDGLHETVLMSNSIKIDRAVSKLCGVEICPFWLIWPLAYTKS